MSETTNVALTEVALDKLHPNERNPRTITTQAFERLKKSLRDDPEMMKARPVIALPDGTIIGGNMRYRAAESLGWKTIPVAYADLDETQAAQWIIRDNSPYGEWEEQGLAELLYELQQGGSDLDLTGLDAEEVSRLLDTVTGAEHLDADPDDVPEIDAQGEPESKAGEIYELGPHRLLCGDSTDAEAVAQLMDGQRAAMMFADPPYGVSYADKNESLNAADKGNRVQTPIEGDHMAPDEMQQMWASAWRACLPALRPGASFYVSGPQGADLLPFLLCMRDNGLPFRHMIIWAKDHFVLGRSDYHYQHEPIAHGEIAKDAEPVERETEGEAIAYGWTEGAHRFYGGRTQTSLWEIARPSASKLHPTMKPVQLVERAIKNSSKRGEIVLDPFCGSGTTLIAADKAGRIAYVVEKDPRYADVIRKRYADWKAGQE